MRVKIRNYARWIGPYQISDLLRYVKLSEERCDAVGDWLSKADWLYNIQEKRVKVHIDRWDTWNMDMTLSYIILPMLKQLQKGHTSPYTKDGDVPPEMRSTAAKSKKTEYDVDEFHEDRWNWIMQEMIWAFEYKLGEDNEVKWSKRDNKRMQRGFVLFGKYFNSLWD